MSVTSTIPVDRDGAYIQAMRFRAGKAQTISIAASSARNGTAFDSDTRVIQVYSDVDCFVEQGDGTVTALTTDHIIPSGFLMTLSLGGDKTTQMTHIAVIRSSTDGTLYISEME